MLHSEILSGALAAFGKITFFDRIQRHAASGDANKNLDISLDVCARGPKPKSRPLTPHFSLRAAATRVELLRGDRGWRCQREVKSKVS
jgi:hypothetical protein